MKFNEFSNQVNGFIEEFGLLGKVHCDVVITSVLGDTCFVDVEFSSVNHFVCQGLLAQVLSISCVYGVDYRSDALVVKAVCEYE